MTDASTDDHGDATSESRVGTLVAGRYRLAQLLGSGGMGAVYRAEHVHMKKAVAVKILHSAMTLVPEVVARFEREAVAAGRIEHPNVVAATDFGRLEDESCYLVLEFVQGQSLRDRLAEGALASSRVVHIARQIASALEAAHAAGVVHRDLKPDNVMLIEREGDVDFVKVLDFGIAKVALAEGSGPALTQLGTVFGTPEYMSAEQAQGAAVDSRSDLYTVGVILYEMLSGETPFCHEDLVVVLTRHLTEAPPPLPASVDPALAGLVMQLLQKDPEARVQSAMELGQRLDQIAPMLTPQPPPFGHVPVSGHVDTVPSLSSPFNAGPITSPSAASAITQPGNVNLAAQADATFAALAPMGREIVARLRAPVNIAGTVVQVWVPVVVGLALLLGVVGVLFGATGLGVLAHSRGGPAPSASVATVEAPLAGDAPPGLTVLGAAASGVLSAISEIETVPQERRRSEDWYAIGQGRAHRSEHALAVAAYSRAVALRSELGKERQLLIDVREAAGAADAAAVAVELLAKLGAGGADVLYEVWDTSTRPETKKLAGAALDRPALRAVASPALQVALDLRAAHGCGAYKAALASAAEHGDARSLRFLRPLTATKGCGFLRLGDCWGCLRGDKQLSAAVARAEKQPAPKL